MRRKGFALIAAVFIMLVLGMLAVGLAGIYSAGAKESVEYADGVRASVLADSGVRWVFQREFAGDLDFTNNASPTGAPSDPNSTPVSFAGGKFWVEYSNATAADVNGGVPPSIDFKVTAKVNNAKRVVKTRLTLLSTKAIRQAIHDTYKPGMVVGGSGTGIDLKEVSSSSGVSGEIESSGTIQVPPEWITNQTAPKMHQNSQYSRFLGIDRDKLVDWADAGGGWTLHPGDPQPPGKIWHGPMTLVGPGQFGLAGCLVGSLSIDKNCQVTWAAVSRDIDGDGIEEILPAVTDGVFLDGATGQSTSSLKVDGVLGGPVALKGPCTLTSGPILGAVTIVPSGNRDVYISISGGGRYSFGDWGLKDAPKWLKIMGPKVEYTFSNWQEEISS